MFLQGYKMAALVFLLPDGKVYIKRGQDDPWKDSGLRVSDMPEPGSSLVRSTGIDIPSYEMPYANRCGQIGRFTLAKNGKLTLQMLPKLPERASSYTFSPSGRYLFLEQGGQPDYTIWRHTERGWRLLLKGITFRSAHSSTDDRNYLSIYFDRSERYLCVVQTFRLFVNSNYEIVGIYEITRSGLKSVFDYKPSGDNSIRAYVSHDGWFLSMSGQGIPDTYRLSTPTHYRKAHLTLYGDGEAVGPPLGDTIALWQSNNKLRIPTGANRSILQQYPSHGSAPIYYWQGVGPVWYDYQEQSLIIGNQRSALPKVAGAMESGYSTLLFVPSEK